MSVCSHGQETIRIWSMAARGGLAERAAISGRGMDEANLACRTVSRLGDHFCLPEMSWTTLIDK